MRFLLFLLLQVMFSLLYRNLVIKKTGNGRMNMPYILDTLQRSLYVRFYVQGVQAGRCAWKRVSVMAVMWNYSV